MRKNKKIGIFTSSTPIGALFPKRLANSISFLEKKGFLVLKGKLISSSDDGYRSGTISDRVAEINELIDEEVDILLASIGGFNSSSLLPHLPYNRINEAKIIVCGFSDTTAILNAIVKNCPQARAIYSPSLVPSFGLQDECAEISYQHFSQILEAKEIKLKPLNFFYKTKIDWNLLEKNSIAHAPHFKDKSESEWKTFNLNENKNTLAEGLLFGGNGSTLSSLLGSKFVPKFPKKGILFIEDEQQSSAQVERIFASFLNHGVFHQASAVILGKHFGFKGTKEPWMILKEILDFNQLKLPVIYDVDVSHFQPMLSLELNKNTLINFKEKTISQNLK